MFRVWIFTQYICQNCNLSCFQWNFYIRMTIFLQDKLYFHINYLFFYTLFNWRIIWDMKKLWRFWQFFKTGVLWSPYGPTKNPPKNSVLWPLISSPLQKINIHKLNAKFAPPPLRWIRRIIFTKMASQHPRFRGRSH